MASPLAPVCQAGGNFNPYYARCVCPIGRSGRFCEVEALPACRARRASTVVACAVRRPQHCNCVQQCLQSGAFAAHIYKYCFIRTLSSSVPHSEVPMLSAAAQFYAWSPGRPPEQTAITRRLVPAEEALAVEFYDDKANQIYRTEIRGS